MNESHDLSLAFLMQHPRSAAIALDELDTTDVVAFLNDVPARISAPVIALMSRWKSVRCLAQLETDRASGCIEAMNFHDAVNILHVASIELRKTLLAPLPTELRQKLEAALNYPDGTVGAAMDPSAAMFSVDASVEDALRYVRQHRHESIGHILLYNNDKEFVGAIDLATLIRSQPDYKLSSLDPVWVQPVSNRATLISIADDPEWDEYPHRPVIGRSKVLLGGLSRRLLRLKLRTDYDRSPHLESTFLLGDLFSTYVYSAQKLLVTLAGSKDDNAADRST